MRIVRVRKADCAMHQLRLVGILLTLVGWAIVQGAGVVDAVDARTGRLKWRWDPRIPHQTFSVDERGKRQRLGPSLCCGPVNRGVAYHEGKVFVGTLDSRLVALDANTGRPVWTTQVASKADDYSITGAPRVIKGRVITGTSGAEFGVRGFVAAYDADTGEKLWSSPLAPGFANPDHVHARRCAVRHGRDWPQRLAGAGASLHIRAGCEGAAAIDDSNLAAAGSLWRVLDRDGAA
jgi:hypothetical protein